MSRHSIWFWFAASVSILSSYHHDRGNFWRLMSSIVSSTKQHCNRKVEKNCMKEIFSLLKRMWRHSTSSLESLIFNFFWPAVKGRQLRSSDCHLKRFFICVTNIWFIVVLRTVNFLLLLSFISVYSVFITYFFDQL